MSYEYVGIDHIQLAAPEGCEQDARNFFADLLGWAEIPKPEILMKRGGIWFQCGSHQVHRSSKRFRPSYKGSSSILC